MTLSSQNCIVTTSHCYCEMSLQSTIASKGMANIYFVSTDKLIQGSSVIVLLVQLYDLDSLLRRYVTQEIHQINLFVTCTKSSHSMMLKGGMVST